MPKIAITLENLDEIFTYHQWSPEQVEKGNKIRAAAKELARAILNSGPSVWDGEGEEPNLRLLARQKRKDALQMVTECVMAANAGITYEASVLVPIAPELAHTERIGTTVA